MIHVSHSLEQTQNLAAATARLLPVKHGGKPIIIALEGELGAGKTTFTQAFAKELGVHNIKSPTFVLMKHYVLTSVTNYHTLYHLDCYRLKDSKDLDPLGVKEILENSGVIVLIEWAERVADILPKHHLVIHIDHPPEDRAGVAEQTRNISITNT